MAFLPENNSCADHQNSKDRNNRVHYSSLVAFFKVKIFVNFPELFPDLGLLQPGVVKTKEDYVEDPINEADCHQHKGDPITAVYCCFPAVYRLDIEQSAKNQNDERTVNEGQNPVAAGLLQLFSSESLAFRATTNAAKQEEQEYNETSNQDQIKASKVDQNKGT